MRCACIVNKERQQICRTKDSFCFAGSALLTRFCLEVCKNLLIRFIKVHKIIAECGSIHNERYIYATAVAVLLMSDVSTQLKLLKKIWSYFKSCLASKQSTVSLQHFDENPVSLARLRCTLQ